MDDHFGEIEGGEAGVDLDDVSAEAKKGVGGANKEGMERRGVRKAVTRGERRRFRGRGGRGQRRGWWGRCSERAGGEGRGGSAWDSVRDWGRDWEEGLVSVVSKVNGAGGGEESYNCS